MDLEGTDYGIHGTDIPWSIGRLVTHGCIRMYPEDIPQLFKLVKPGTEVRIIYEPVKIGRVSGRVYVEVHRDIYNRIEDLTAYGYKRLGQKGLLESVDLDKFRQALDLQEIHQKG
jgi:L,D-transpeptidase ErfK/SrfK